MPEVIPGLAVSFFILMGVLVLIGMRRTASHWVGALLGSFSEQRGFRRWFFHAIGLTAAVNAITWVVHRVEHALGTTANANIAPVATYLRGVAAALHFAIKEYGAIADSWASDFAWFRHRTLPRVVKHEIAPTAHAAAQAGALAGRSISLGQRERRERTQSIDRLKRETGLLAGILLGIDILVKGRHARAHHHDHTVTLPHAAAGAAAAGAAAERVARDHARTKSRVKNLERWLARGAIVGLILRVIAKRWRWLFCNNWRRGLGPLGCALRPGVLNALTGLLLAVIVLRDLLGLARHAEGLVGGFAHGIVTTLTGTELPAGRFTID